METNPLTLIVKEKTLGNLVTNAKDIKAYVAEKLKEYSVENCESVKDAANKKAEINNAIKTLNDRRIALEKEWNLPFQEFKEIIAETTGMMKTVSGNLDAIVKVQENREKEAKKASIEELWAAKRFNLVPLARVFNMKWLNKTAKLTSVDAELDDIIKRINGDLASLDAFGEDTATLKDLYLSTLNLQITLSKGAELKANRERLAAMEAQKKVEAEKEQETIPTEVKNKTVQSEIVKPVEEEDKPEPKEQEKPVYKFNIYGEENEVASVREIAQQLGIKIIPSITLEGDEKRIELFKNIISDNGIGYDKAGIINLAVKRIG